MNLSTAQAIVSPMPMQTERLQLRLLNLDDAEFMLELLNDADFLSQIGDRGVRTAEDARRYLETGPMASYAQFGFGMWAVETLDGGHRAGICGLIRRAGLDAVDIGYAFLPAWRGRGYALEAAETVMRLARGFFSLPRVVAITAPHNVASAALLGKLGFRFEQMVRMGEEADEVRLFSWMA